MKHLALFLLVFSLHSTSQALTLECEADIKNEIQQFHDVKPESFRTVTFSNYLLDNGEHQIWKDIGYDLISVQYYHDTEFVEIMVKLAKNTCNVLETMELFQHDM